MLDLSDRCSERRARGERSQHGRCFTSVQIIGKSLPERSLITEDMATKPFSPNEVQRIIQTLHRPAVFLNMTDDWPGRDWTLEHLAICLGEKSVYFRIGKRDEGHGPLFETQCSYVEATLAEFLCWTKGKSDSSVGPFSSYPLSEYWAYADYKYIVLLFQEKATMFKDVVWSDFGYSGRDGRESTLWIGTNGANTPCHLDTYGYNLVFQIQENDGISSPLTMLTVCTQHAFHTRSPVCSAGSASLNLICASFLLSGEPEPMLRLCNQVLFVPRHWWHYVESVDPVTVSVNSWMDMEIDDEARVGEALTKIVVSALKTTASLDNKDNWLNPTEEGISSHDENIKCLNLAVKALMDKRSTQAEDSSEFAGRSGSAALKRDAAGRLKTKATDPVPPFPLPFGPHLIPVTCDGDCCQKQTASSLKETLLSKDNAHFSTPNRTEPQPTDTHQQGEAASISEELKENDRRNGEKYGSISTNDVLDCLLHPDVISLVTQLMIDRQRELDPK
ncbi:HSPB1-associated protein 1 homolog isoform X2 [Astyanax mexicanus]|uniref:HSPB1-associated protein 1 homolog isoform X2 n=1 Tax=Astyanax mexicanus TaxID=7994 RepID=UPI0020CB05DF|nr:HSPB1-associated protein 1 homolog isoform X2 [Astyanax mexicanus]